MIPEVPGGETEITPNPTPLAPQPEVTIEDTEIPLTAQPEVSETAPEEVSIADEAVPLTQQPNPHTGQQDGGFWTWLLAAMAGLGLSTTWLEARRKKDEEQAHHQQAGIFPACFFAARETCRNTKRL